MAIQPIAIPTELSWLDEDKGTKGIKERKKEMILPVISDVPCTISNITEENFKHPHDNFRHHGDLVPGIHTFLV
jgi:hypothetical protein